LVEEDDFFVELDDFDFDEDDEDFFFDFAKAIRQKEDQSDKIQRIMIKKSGMRGYIRPAPSQRPWRPA